VDAKRRKSNDGLPNVLVAPSAVSTTLADDASLRSIKPWAVNHGSHSSSHARITPHVNFFASDATTPWRNNVTEPGSPVDQELRSAVADLLSAYGRPVQQAFMVGRVPVDGDNQFAAVALAATGKRSNHVLLRRCVRAYIHAHQDSFVPFLDDDCSSLDQWLATIGEVGCRGTEQALKAAEEVLDVFIVVLTKDKTGYKVYGEDSLGLATSSRPPIVFLLLEGGYYSAIVPCPATQLECGVLEDERITTARRLRASAPQGVIGRVRHKPPRTCGQNDPIYV
jgi:hypothetical protein